MRVALALTLACGLFVSASAHGPGQVTMQRTFSGWSVLDPFGADIDTSGSTSEGLQEAINYAHDHGYALMVLGGSQLQHTGADPARITTTQTIRIPAGAKGSYTFKGITLWANVPDESDAIDIDCQDMLDLDFGGQLVYPGIYSAVGLFCANTYYEGDIPYCVFTSSRLRIQTIALVDRATMQPQHDRGTAISINPMAPFTGLTIEVNEINGGQTPYAVYQGIGPVQGVTWLIRWAH